MHTVDLVKNSSREALRGSIDAGRSYAVAIEPAGSAVSELVSPLWWTTQLSILAVTFAALAWMTPHLPSLIPMQYGFDGEVSRYGSVLELWLVTGGLLLMNLGILVATAFSLSRERVALIPGQEERHLELHRTRRRYVVGMLGATLALMSGGIASLSLALGLTSLAPPSGLLAPPLFWCGGALIVVALVGPLAWYLPRLHQVGQALQAMGGSHVLGTRAEGWLAAGLIYYAPNDPAVFVPKAVGVGQTLNFARPAAWLFLAGALLIPLGLLALVTFGR